MSCEIKANTDHVGCTTENIEASAGLPADVSIDWKDMITVRSLLVGSILGTVTTMENIYFSLKYGWTVSNNIAATIAGFVCFRGLQRMIPSASPFTPQENCILMTVAVSGTACVWGGSLPFALLAMSEEIRSAAGFPGDYQTWEVSFPKLMIYCAG